MIFIILVIIIAVISVFLALFSLRRELQKHEVEEARKDILKGRVIFHSSDINKD